MRAAVRLLPAACALAVCGGAQAISLPLARGADATFDVYISNAAGSTVAFPSFVALLPPSWAWDGYGLTTLTPACSLQPASINVLLNAIRIVVDEVPAHGSIRCSIAAHRKAESLYAIQLGFANDTSTPATVTLDDRGWTIGPLADLAISARQVPPFPAIGGGEGIVEVTLTNHGPWDVLHADFGYCQDIRIAPFVLDNAIAGGCAGAASGMACFALGPPSVQFGVGTLTAHETKSCRLRVVAGAPLTAPIAFPVTIISESPSASGEYPTDPDDGNDRTDLVIAPRTAAVPTGSATPLLPIVLVLATWIGRRVRLRTGA